MRIKDLFISKGFFKVGDGSDTRFWEDVWLGATSIADQYPALYNIVQRKNVMVAHVLNQTPLNIEFRRVLSGNRWTSWLHLCRRLMGIHLTNDKDRFVWKLSNNSIFSVKSMYKDLMNNHTPYRHKFLWKMKIPLKIKIFMWFLNNKVILTKDNLAKRKWKGCTKCVFCGEQESVEHLFIHCPFAKLIWRTVNFAYNLHPPTSITNMFGNWLVRIDRSNKACIRTGVTALCWSIWKCRNDIVFNKKIKFHFLQVIHMMAHWVQLWAYLLPLGQRDIMVSGCSQLQMVAQDILCRAGWQHISRLQ
jgi:hypothetical protein